MQEQYHNQNIKIEKNNIIEKAPQNKEDINYINNNAEGWILKVSLNLQAAFKLMTKDIDLDIVFYTLF